MKKKSFIILLLICLSTISFANSQTHESIDKMVPSRSQVPTKWETGSYGQVTLNESGFVEGYFSSYYSQTYPLTDYFFYAYRFSDSSTAKLYCDNQVAKIKAEGGYDEVPITGAFGAYDYSTAETNSWGVSKDIVFSVQIYSESFSSRSSDLITYTNLQRSIIDQQSTTVDTSPTQQPTVQPSSSGKGQWSIVTYGENVNDDVSAGILSFTVTDMGQNISRISFYDANEKIEMTTLHTSDYVVINYKDCKADKSIIPYDVFNSKYSIAFIGEANSVSVNSLAVPEFPLTALLAFIVLSLTVALTLKAKAKHVTANHVLVSEWKEKL